MSDLHIAIKNGLKANESQYDAGNTNYDTYYSIRMVLRAMLEVEEAK